MKKHCIYSLICLLFCGIISSCTEDFAVKEEAELHGLVMQLQIDGNPVSAPASRVAADPTMRENVVSHVDVFFSSDGTNIDYYTHAALGTDNRLVLAGADWKTHFPKTSYTVYVIANKHSYEDETDYLSDIETVEQLKSLTDTDTEVNKAEGEQVPNSDTYSGKLFFMDGVVTTWTPPTDAVDETIEVELYRAAAKFVVNVSFASNDEFNLEDISIIGVRKKVVNYMPEAMALKEVTPDYETLAAVMGDASSNDMSNTNYTNGKENEERKDILYAYAYPNDWGDDAVRETYLLMNVPYSENDKVHNNYYKVPIRFSNDADELHIDRNTQYTVNVTVDRKGNEEIDKPIPLLNPTFNVAAWEPETINVNDDAPSYLILSHEHIEMHNVADTVITFFSSDYLSNVQIDDAYFINKDGEETRRQFIEEGDRWNPDEYKDVEDFCTIEWDENTLQGSIKFHGDIPTNVTARYVTLRVTSSDPNLEPNYKDVTIVQYPLEYISGVPGKYATRDDYEGNTYQAYRDGTHLDNPLVYSSFGNTGGFYSGSYTFYSKVYEGTTIYQVDRDSHGNNGNRYYTLERGSVNASGQNNNRMYLVQMTSTSGDYTVARPKTEMENGQLVTVSNAENNQLVSPAFMLASQLGVITSSYGGGSWGGAKEHCKYYVEVVEYEDSEQNPKEIRILDDWRLPTEAELEIIGIYQNTQPEVMANVLIGQRYWTALSNTYYRVPQGSTDATGVRCVRDVSPEDLAEFRAHNIR